MAKRVRGSSTRPGQRARLQRAPRSARASDSPRRQPSTTLTPAEEARAAELEAEIVAAERDSRGGRRSRPRAPAGDRPSRGAGQAGLDRGPRA